jgi:predicted GNAT family N-acyltransferase
MSHTSATPFYYEAAPVLTSTEREAVFAVRMTVFVEEQAVPAEEELDAYDIAAMHFLARRVEADASDIVGTARLVDKGHGVGKVGRVAVLREHRGHGVGALLMRRVEHEARAAGYTELILEAQCHALPFYEKLGYLAEGDIFLDCNIEHRLMRKSL